MCCAALRCAAVPAFITPMVLFSGFLYDTATLPPYLAWLPKASIVNYGFSALVRARLGLGFSAVSWSSAPPLPFPFPFPWFTLAPPPCNAHHR
jgi:hypothetical protein